MRCIQDAGSALRLEFLALIVRLYGEGLVIREQYHVRPFLDERGNLRAGLFAELQLPAVVSAQLVRLLEFPQLRVRRQHDVDAGLHNLLKAVEKFSKRFFFVYVAVAITEILDAFFVVCRADIIDAELLRPVDRVNDERVANAAVLLDILHLAVQHGPARGLIKSLYVHPFCAALGIDEERPGKFRRKAGFPDAFRAVNNDLLRRSDFSACDVH